MNNPTRTWEVRRAPTPQLESLSAALGVSPLLAQLLCNRGLDDPAAASAFLDDPETGGVPPAPLPGLGLALERLVQAIEGGEPITAFGDYDVDGVTGAALLYLYLKRAGATVDYYLPNRMVDGYGMTIQAVETLAARGTKLIITADCGISALAEIARAKELGIDTIVTDHHEPPPQLPDAVAILDPKLDPSRPEWHVLPGVGVAYHLMLNLHMAYGLGPPPAELLDIVAIGTIADMAAMRGPNRHMVRQGLVALQYTERPGLRALKELAGIAPDAPLTAAHIGYRLAPKINAVGRLGDPRLAFELLVEEDYGRAREIAAEMDRLNQQRQQLCERTTAQALAMVERGMDLSRERVIVLAHEEWHPGVIGIVASRLMETYQRPVVLVALENAEGGRGSGRSVQGFNLFEAMTAASDLFTRFGGHGQAAGFTIPPGNVPALKQAMEAHAAGAFGSGWEPVLGVEALVPLGRLDRRLLAEIERLAPFGESNPRPVLACRDVERLNQRRSRDGSHLFVDLGDGNGARIAAVGWRMGDRFPLPERVDVAFELELDDYNGNQDVRLKLVDVRPTRPDRWRVHRPEAETEPAER